MIDQKQFLENIGFALAGLDMETAEEKLTFLKLIKEEVEYQEEKLKEKGR